MIILIPIQNVQPSFSNLYIPFDIGYFNLFLFAIELNIRRNNYYYGQPDICLFLFSYLNSCMNQCNVIDGFNQVILVLPENNFVFHPVILIKKIKSLLNVVSIPEMSGYCSRLFNNNS